MSFEESAVRLLLGGRNVMPLRANGKRPLYSEWLFLKDRRLKEEELRSAFRSSPDANIAIITGKLSDLTVVDVDILKEGTEVEKQASVIEAEKLLKALPETFTVQTPSGGYHLYYRYDKEIPNMSNKCIHPQIDLRGEGGYVVAPPSVIEGVPYKVIKAVPVAPFPQELKRLLTTFAKDPNVQRTMWVDIARGVGHGSRNATMTQLLGRFLNVFAKDPNRQFYDKDVAFVYHIVFAWNKFNNTPPLDQEEFNRTFTSIVNRHYGELRSRSSTRVYGYDRAPEEVA